MADAVPTPATPGATVDPFRNFNFKLEIGGVTRGHFTACTSIGMGVQPISYREGGIGQVVRRMPGHVRYADVRLSLRADHLAGALAVVPDRPEGEVERQERLIIMLGSDGSTEACAGIS